MGAAPVVDVVGLLQPGFLLLHPVGAGENARVFVGVAEQAPFMAETGEFAHGVDGVDAGLDAVLVEVDVAGDADGVDEAHRPGGGAVGVMEEVVVDLDGAGAVEAGIGRAVARFQPGEGDHDLVGRSGRVGMEGAVEHRGGRVLVERVPVLGLDFRDEFVRVVARDGRHGEDVAIARVHHDDRAAADPGVAHGGFGDILDAGVDGEVKGAAHGRLLAGVLERLVRDV